MSQKQIMYNRLHSIALIAFTSLMVLFAIIPNVVQANQGPQPVEVSPVQAQATATPQPTYQSVEECAELKQEGVTLSDAGNYAKSSSQYQKALDCYQQFNDWEGIARVYNNWGLNYKRQAEYTLAEFYFLQALEIAQEYNLRELEAIFHANFGQLYYDWEKYPEGQTHWIAALTIAQELDLRDIEPYAHFYLGRIYYELGEYSEAIIHSQAVLPYFEEVGRKSQEAVTWLKIGDSYRELTQPEPALEAYEKALTVSRDSNVVELQAEALSSMATVYYAQLGDRTRALEYYSQAVNLYEQAREEGVVADTLLVMAQIAEDSDLYQASIYYNKALKIANKLQDHERIAIIESSLGALYNGLGNYNQGLFHYQQALIHWEELPPQKANQATTQKNIAFTYGSLEQYDEALGYYDKAIELWKSINEPIKLAETWVAVGDLEKYRGQYEESKQAYLAALPIFESGKADDYDIFHIHQKLALLYSMTGEKSKAREHLNRAVALDAAAEYSKLGQNFQAVTSGQIALVYESLHEYSQALQYHDRALTLYREIGDQGTEAFVLAYIGRIYEAQGEPAQALEVYLQSIALQESLHAAARLEELKIELGEQSADAYQRAILLLARRGDYAQAFELSERARARTFLDQMGNVRVNPRNIDDPQLLEQEKILVNNIHAIQAVLAGQAVSTTIDSICDNDDIRSGNTNNEPPACLNSTLQKHEEQLLKIKLANPEYAALRSVQASTLVTVQQTLPANTTLLEYYVAPTQTLAFVVTQDAFHAVPLSVTEETLYTLIRDFREPPRLEDIPPASRSLYTALVAPIREYIRTDALLFVPHGPLHYVPFGAFYDGQRFLVESYAIGYAPSASVLTYLKPGKSSERAPALVFGTPSELRPLAGIEAEAHSIAELLGVVAYIDTAATETLFWQAAANAHHIHLAAHAKFEARMPQFSRIYLAKDGQNDGYLEVQEIWNLRLEQADLVTLSACETQTPYFKILGDEMAVTAGDELIGLSRAFFYAGAPSLVVSLWLVEDRPTQFFMEHFYSQLIAGKGKAVALRQAQLDTMQVYPNPLDWSAFTLIGDMGIVKPILLPTPTAIVPTPTPQSTGGSGVCGSALLPLVIGVVWIIRRRRTMI